MALNRSHIPLEVHLGNQGLCIGYLYFTSDKRSAFRYDDAWLQSPDFFSVSPELSPVSGLQYPTGTFMLALEDTAPDAWGKRVIRRAHAKMRKQQQNLTPLRPTDFLTWVDDDARIGALRLFDAAQGAYLRNEKKQRHIPPLVELGRVLEAARALEIGEESNEDLSYLLGQGTSLGGARPKSIIKDADGALALGKFPSQGDQRDVIRGEVLAMTLAEQVGITTASARVELVKGTPIAVIRRFDRTRKGNRIPYLSAASMLQSKGRDEIHAYTELVDVLQECGTHPLEDSRALWCRLVFNYLICNTDDHLHNTGFLYDARHSGWLLSPAFDLNPMPGDRRESKVWLTEDSGPIDSQHILMEGASYFRLTTQEATRLWRDMSHTVSKWESLAKGLGMSAADLTDFAPAFTL